MRSKHTRIAPVIASELVFRRSLLLFSVASIFWIILRGAGNSVRFIYFPSGSLITLPNIFPSFINGSDSEEVRDDHKLENLLKSAAMEDGTIILTTLNEAWAAPNAVADLFLESFRIGENTSKFLNHLVIIALDQAAYSRCIQVHTHCFGLFTDGANVHEEAYFMTPDYLEMMWRRIDFLKSILQLGFNFIFTDADIMWLRDPFPWFYSDADFQIACDHFTGSSVDLGNEPNGGFSYVRSNNRTVGFYDFWYSSREKYPGYHDQAVLNFIKSDPLVGKLGLKIRFLDTAYFGGFCEPSRDLNLACTMHANCCLGLQSKLHDLKIMLQDWKSFISLPPIMRKSSSISWSVPQNCSVASLSHHNVTGVSDSDQQELKVN